MDTALFVIASTATYQVGHFEQHMHTPMRPMDRGVSAIAATATHQGGHFEQHMHTPMRPMDRGVFASEPNAIYANGLHQKPLCKHDHPNGNLQSEATGALPNFHTLQQIYTRRL